MATTPTLILLAACSSGPTMRATDAGLYTKDVLRTQFGVEDAKARSWADDDLAVTVETRADGGSWSEVTDLEVSVGGSDVIHSVLVADNSQSVSDYTQTIVDAVSGFGGAMLDGGHQAGLVRVSTDATVWQSLTGDGAVFEDGAQSLFVTNGWTALWDGVRLASDVLALGDSAYIEVRDLNACVGASQPNIVLFTDGQENNSDSSHASEAYPGDAIDTTLDDLLALEVHGVPPVVYTLGVGDNVSVDDLTTLAEGMGGTHEQISGFAGLADGLADAAEGMSETMPVCFEVGACEHDEARITVENLNTGETASTTVALPDERCEEEVSDKGCTFTQGYWKNHEESWPVDSLTIGDNTYDSDALLDLFDSPTRGDASLVLGHQMIAAMLNVANGSDPTDIADALDDAQEWMTDNDDGDGLPYGVATRDAGDGVDLATTLDEYNNGDIGPGHCDD